MKLLLCLAALTLALTGCQAKTTPATQAAATPKLIEQITNQTLVYECPKCGMDFESTGQCTMCNVDLVATKVEYICPADSKPVESAGKCPRCDANARVMKSTVADAATPDAAPSGS